MLRCIIIIMLVIMLPTTNSIYQARFSFSSTGYQFEPRNSIQLVLNTTAQTRMICAATCNKISACHALDYDSTSNRCRLLEADLTTGLIIASTTLTSVVGITLTSPSQFVHKYNQSCEVCQEDRYVYCPVNESTCQCRPHTFWNGSVCLLQLFQNDTCSQVDACRSDLNLICTTNYGQFNTCTSVSMSTTTTQATTMINGDIPIRHIAGSKSHTSITNTIAITNAITTTITTTDTSTISTLVITATTTPTIGIITITGITTLTTITTTTTSKTTTITTTTTSKTTTITTTTTSKTTTITTTITTTAITISTTVRPNVTTVAGSYNGSCATLSGGLTTLHQQAGIFVSKNGTLYVADGVPTNTLYTFTPNNLTGQSIMSFGNWPTYIFIDPSKLLIYVTIHDMNRVQIWPSNRTIPPNPVSSGCNMSVLLYPTSIIVDSSGNVYISSYGCHWVTKWAPNATTSTLVVGVSPAASGSDNIHLYRPYGLSLDENHSFLYVVDRFNHRVQKFVLGNSTGVTVAGGNGAGAASNQLDTPTSIYVSRQDNSYYICDCGNARIQKWAMNALFGVTIAGSSSGTAGNTLYLLNQPYDIWIDSNETYMFISDTNNCRVQKYLL